MNREQKTQLVENLKHNLGASKFVAIVHYAGINDKSLYDITEINAKGEVHFVSSKFGFIENFVAES